MGSRIVGAARREEHRPGAGDQVSLVRLYFLRVGYLIFAVGLALTKWPLLVDHAQPWPLMDGVETSMLVALSLLAFLGIRYPLKMLPVLLFECGWKLVWLLAVVLPLWTADQIDPGTLGVVSTFPWVLIIVVVIPWGYVFRQYVTNRGDRWRSTPSRPIDEDGPPRSRGAEPEVDAGV
jgi:hypothetical protein